MPLPQHIREELELKRAAEHEQAERDSFRARVRTALLCVFWSCVGLLCMGFGLHTTDLELGKIAWQGGMIVGYTGILVTLARAFLKARERGDTE
jgi:hypothetical protein